MVNVYMSAAEAEARSPYAQNPQTSGQYQQQQSQQSQNQQNSRRTTAHWDQARQEWVAGEPTQQSNYNNRPSGNNPNQAYGGQGQQLTYQQQAEQLASQRAGFTDPQALGDINTQRRASELAQQGMTYNAAIGVVLNQQYQEAQKTQGTRDDIYYLTEGDKWKENIVERGSAYHHLGQDIGEPIPANPYEYQADLAVEALKGDPGKRSEWFSPVSGEMSRQLPGGQGSQEVGWDIAKSQRANPADFTNSVNYLNAAEGKYGPYGQLYGGDKWMQANPKSPSETIRMQGIRLTEQQAMDIDWAASAGKQQATALFQTQDDQTNARLQSEKISFLGGEGLPAGVFATGVIGKVESGNAPFFAPQPLKVQSPVGGLIGLQLWGSKKDEVIRGLIGSSVDFVTGMVGLTPFADRMTETAPELSVFRAKKQSYESQLESLGKTGEQRFGKDEQGRILIDQTNPESLAFQRDYSKVTGQYETFLQESKTKGLVIEEQGKMIENPYLVYEYGEFTKWGIGVGASARNALGVSKSNLDLYQRVLEEKKGIANIPEKLAFGATYTTLTHPEKAMSAAGGGALFVLGGEVIGGMYAGSGVATRAGAFALSHPTAAAIGSGAFRYGGAAVLGGLTYYGASEQLTASPERTTINFGKMIPEFGGMIVGGAAVYRGMGYRGVGFISKEEQAKLGVIDVKPGYAKWDTSKTQGSFWDDIIYERGTDSWVKRSPTAKLKMMTPDEYIGIQKEIMQDRVVGYGHGDSTITSGDTIFRRGITQEKLQPIIESLKNPKNTFESLVIERESTGKLKDFQEGRHRALAAKELGIEKIPVWEFTDKKIVSKNYMGLELRKDRYSEQKLKPAPTIVDLRDLVDLTLAPQRPMNVATRAEQAMVMAQYKLSPQEIRLAKMQGLSLTDILGLRELEAPYATSVSRTRIETIVIPDFMLQEQKSKVVSGLYGNAPMIGSNVIQRMKVAQMFETQQATRSQQRTDIFAVQRYAEMNRAIQGTYPKLAVSQVQTNTQIQNRVQVQQEERIFAPMSISRVIPVLAILPKEMGIQKTIPDKPFAPMITRPGRPAPPFEPTPTRPVVPFAWLPGAGESGGGRPFLNRGEYGWSNINPVSDIPYLSKGLGDPFSGGGSGSMGGFGAKCRHTNAKLKKKCSRFKRNG